MDTFKDKQQLEEHVRARATRPGSCGSGVRDSDRRAACRLGLVGARPAPTSCASARTATTSRSAAAARSCRCSRAATRRSSVHWVVFTRRRATRGEEARESAARFLGGARRRATSGSSSFRDGLLPLRGRRRQGRTSRRSKASVAPDLVFTHYGARPAPGPPARLASSPGTPSATT